MFTMLFWRSGGECVSPVVVEALKTGRFRPGPFSGSFNCDGDCDCDVVILKVDDFIDPCVSRRAIKTKGETHHPWLA